MKKWGWGSFYGNSLLVHTKKIYSKSIAVSRVPLPERETDLHKLANIALALPGFRATEAMLISIQLLPPCKWYKFTLRNFWNAYLDFDSNLKVVNYFCNITVKKIIQHTRCPINLKFYVSLMFEIISHIFQIFHPFHLLFPS